MSYIQKLQSKSEGARKQILTVSLFVCMSVVVLVWIYNLTDTFGNQTAMKTEDTIKPFQLFANSISNTYENISASVGKIPSSKPTTDSSQKQIDLIVVQPKTNQ